ncbi:MAG: tRNA (adenosine(37)-N6)-dimethylallyltransferase MiaA [Deltaproteobacteria bacterium]|jgi:tRNA dimethylallyltransferase|nr:tRNA (adenosine(37)-N6)-dimethylallyltransferase MiaA [Deltaproteobacteria bacterium]
MTRPKAIILTGPTGSGKSRLALGVGEALGAEIINADSLAFYRGLDIGTAKPTEVDRQRVPHHLLDILDPDEPFDAAAYLALARPLVERLWRADRPALIVGGTGLYLRSLCRGLFPGPGRQEGIRAELREARRQGQDLHALLAREDPLAAARIQPRDLTRLERALEVIRATGRSIVDFQGRHNLADQPFETLTLIIDRPTAELDADIRRRTSQMFAAGLLAETRNLLSAGWDPDLKPLKAIGYLEAQACLAGEISLETAQERVFLRTRRLAKRQRTWFRGQLAEGLWVPPDPAKILSLIREFWANR